MNPKFFYQFPTFTYVPKRVFPVIKNVNKEKLFAN